jgi:hypothetical protein
MPRELARSAPFQDEEGRINNERLDVGRRDQSHRVAQLANLPRPVVRSTTRLERHDTRRLPREELEHLGPRQPLAEHHMPGRVGAMGLEYLLNQPDYFAYKF